MRRYFIRIVLAVISVTFSVHAEEVRLSPINLNEKVSGKRLFYRIFRTDKEVFLQLINAYERDIFVPKQSLKIASFRVVNVKDPQRFSSPYFAGAWGGLGPADFVRLAFDSHEDGSICSWQITPCGSLPYKYENLDDLVEMSARFSAFVGSKNEYVDFVIDHSSTVSEIPLVEPQK
jgi:hypothetical protein